MKTSAMPALLISAVIAMGATAQAGDAAVRTRPSRTHATTVTTAGQDSFWSQLALPTLRRSDYRPTVLATIGNVFNSVLSTPQILQETVMGDRTFVNERGLLAPRETPPEERYVTLKNGAPLGTRPR